MLYLRNGRVDWHGTKGMWVDRMLHPLCDFQLWPQPWPWPWIFKVKFWKVISQEWGGRLTWDERDVSRWNVKPMLWLSTFPSPMTLTLDFQGQFWKSLILWMGWPIDIERKGCESIECWTHVVTFNVHLFHDPDLGLSRSNFEKGISQEWDGRLTWNKRDVSR